MSTIQSQRRNQVRQHAEKNARYYDLKKPQDGPCDKTGQPDELLNISAIVFEYNVDPTTIRWRQRKGWPSAGRAILEPHERKFPHKGRSGDGYPEDTFKRQEIERFLQPETSDRIPQPTALRELRKLVKRMIELSGLDRHHRLCGITNRTAKDWADNGCHLTNGTRLTRFKDGGETFWSKTQYDDITKALLLPDGHVEINEQRYIDEGAAEREFKLKRYFLEACAAVGLVAMMGDNKCGHKGSPKRLYRRSDLQRLTPELLAAIRAELASFDGEYSPDADGVRRFNRPRALLYCKEQGIACSESFLKKQIYPPKRDATSGRGFVLYHPDGQLPYELRKPPVTKQGWKNEECTVRADDLDKLLDGIRQAEAQGKRGGFGDYRDVQKALKRNGVDIEDTKAQVILGSALRVGRESGQITAYRPEKPMQVRGGQRQRPWLYNIKEAVAFITPLIRTGMSQAEVDEALAFLGQSHENGQPTTPPSPERQPHNSAAVDDVRRKRRGPRRSAVTQEVYTACYDLLADNSRRVAMRLLRERFTHPIYASSIPKEERHISEYARRRANDPDDPRPWPIPGRRP